MTAVDFPVCAFDRPNTTGTNRSKTIGMNRPLPIGTALAAALRKMPEPGRAIVAPIARDLERRR